MPRPSWERRCRDNRGATEAGRDRSGKQWAMAQMLCERLAAKHEFAVALLLPRSASGSSFSAQQKISQRFVSAKRWGAWTRLSAEPRLIAPGTRISPPRDSPAGRLLLSSPKHFCVAPNPRAVDLLSTLKTQRLIPCAVSYLAFFFSPPSRLCSDGSFFLYYFFFQLPFLPLRKSCPLCMALW